MSIAILVHNDVRPSGREEERICLPQTLKCVLSLSLSLPLSLSLSLLLSLSLSVLSLVVRSLPWCHMEDGPPRYQWAFCISRHHQNVAATSAGVL
jgi:hypothetical protein